MYVQMSREELQLVSRMLLFVCNNPLADSLADRIGKIEQEAYNTHKDVYAAYHKAAGEILGGEYSLDDEPTISFGDEGAQVLCWLWVEKIYAGICLECGATNADNGEGFDGLCGECADKKFNEEEDESDSAFIEQPIRRFHVRHDDEIWNDKDEFFAQARDLSTAIWFADLLNQTVLTAKQGEDPENATGCPDP